MGPLIILVSLYPLTWASYIQQLNPNGNNVCSSTRGPPSWSCCPGWRQQGNECTIAICEAPNSCSPEEICVRPGVCRCPHGFFGANCVTRCPDQFWGPDCRNVCSCHPNGKCDAVSGICSCYRDRWGPSCAKRCRCKHGHCDPDTGHCLCELGWWGSDCSKMCQCHLGHSLCDPITGKCNCSSGYWGKQCNIYCFCNQSSCAQLTGVCECREGWWGTLCERRCVCVHGRCNSSDGQCLCHTGYQGRTCSEPCTAGFYGDKCRKRCGQCKESQPCSPFDGSCQPCQPGWNGSRCDQPCSPGLYGENCAEKCPRCRDGEFCHFVTGVCRACNPGWIGPRCNSPCTSGTFGQSCQSPCPECNYGKCHHITGECICHVGYTGASCNLTCANGSYGVNCSSPCRCLGAPCDPVTGGCHFSKAGVVTAIVMMTLLILLCIFCCCCCGNDKNDPRNRMLDEEDGPLTRMKHHVQGVLANLGSALPCISFGNQKLPKVTVSHHDADVSFNCSFIDSPSAGWDSASFSSFETDEGEPVYCVPTQEGNGLLPPVGGCQELNSRCNYLPADQADLNSEDGLQPLSIPRTSSIVKAKRPSVSFAEGTKFGPELRRGSMPESRIVPTANAQRKRNLSWTLSKLSPIESEPAAGDSPNAVCQPYECTNLPGIYPEAEGPHCHSRPCGERRGTSSTAKKDSQALESRDMTGTPGEPKVTASDQKVATAYVMPREAKRCSKIWGSSGDGVGTVQAMLKRFGNFQRQRSIPKEELRPRVRGENINKIHRKLAALDKNLKPQASSNVAASAYENLPPRVPAMPAHGTQQGQAEGNATLTKKPLLPTTPILQKLVANMAEDTERRLGTMSSPSQRDNPCEQDCENGHEHSEDIPTQHTKQEIQ
ncbi:scavenger receptor class F member 1 isoform X1 [Carcharodon carcharias]|uniref:scavenger receptor class F member 1 isoform X1 n=1 Tax=Carcharodon carcharias TaxID=13397 RepID=UPI001B7E3A04|nr:scavenger receptor class F member 1 isoform X1 [Carcharodon carcharias]